MADRPILFSAPMVRALLAGTKTQTRRELDVFCDEPPAYVEDGMIKALDPDDQPYRWPRTHAVGDRLWVREAWRTFSTFDDEPPRNLDFVHVWYEADAGYKPKIRYPHGRGRYRHGRFMPRWFSRLTLTVTAVRVERLQEISEADAIAEGVERDSDGWRDYLMPNTQCCANACDSYRTLWEAINGPGSWEANPWAAAYTFTVEHRNIDAGAQP